jgi:hypothetical protein
MADGSGADLDAGFPVSLRRVGCARVRFGPTPSVFLTTSFVFNLDVLDRNFKPVPNQWPPLIDAILRESAVLQLGYEALV